MTTVHDRPFAEVDAATLYRILQLRSQVFVVEQTCVFLEADGRDLEPGCHLLWIEDPGGAVTATARVMDEGGARRIGRIVTALDARQQGLAGSLIDHFLATSEGPWVLDAQARLAEYYGRWGFAVAGDAYDEDGISHVPMHRNR